MEHGILKTVKRIFEETLSNIGFGKEARAQSVSDNIQTLINTNACVGCNLTEATWCHGHWICWACSIGTCLGGDRIDTCKGS